MSAVFDLTITGSSAIWAILRVRGVERVHAPYSFEVLCAPGAAEIEGGIGSLLTKPATLSLRRERTSPRVFHAVVDAVQLDHHDRVLFRLVPSLATLVDAVDHQVFTDEDSVAIATKVLGEHGITLEKQVQRALTKAPQRVQAFESDLAFVSRILAADGLTFIFPIGKKDTIVVVDDKAEFPDAEEVEPLPVRGRGGLVTEEHVYGVTLKHTLVNDKVSFRDYNFEKPLLGQNASEGVGKGAIERYEYPGHYPDPGVGKPLAKIRLESLRARSVVLNGETNCRGLAAGHVIALSHPTNEAMSGRWLVLEVNHSADERDEHHSDEGAEYHASFVATPAATQFRPVERAAPKLGGVQHAVITGPGGAEIHTEQHGRSKMHFRWDRRRPVDDKSSAWVRVVQPPTSGGMMLPRMGWEALVSFYDVSGDTPFVLGRLYNGAATPPNSLPGDKVASAFGSGTTPGGGSKNLVAMNDTKGNEGFSIVASKDMNSKTENDKVTGVHANDSHTIGANNNIIVGNSHELAVSASQTYSVSASRTVNVEANKSVSAASETELIGGLRLFNVGGDYITSCASLTRLVGASKTEVAIEHQVRQVTGASTVLVGGTWKTRAVVNASVSVLGASTQLVSGAKKIKTPKYSLTVRGLYGEKLASRTVKVGGARLEKFAAAAKYDISGSAKIKGSEVHIEATTSITIKASGATIKMDTSSVTINADYKGTADGADSGDEKYD